MDLAVIGMSCRLPGAANLQEYWQLLIEGRSAIQELPPDRLNRDLYYSPVRGTQGKTYSTISGVVPDLSEDPELKDIAPDLLAKYNVASRHLLAVIQSAFRYGGLDARRLFTRKVGVYVGHASGGLTAGRIAFSTHIEDTVQRLRQEAEFARLPEDAQRNIERAIVAEVHTSEPRRLPGGEPFATPPDSAALAARVFGWEGPVMAVDAACASSLQALAVAEQALEHGHCELAVVGGASCNTFCNMVLFSQAQALSDSGSFPFDARANGFISSDGYCAVVVEPLERAIGSGRRILGVVRAIGCSSDGRGHSLWAPGKEGQKLAIERAWGGTLDRSRLQYIEAHATSTPVGDAEELHALAESLGPSIPSGTRIPIASVKANLGHTKEAAGLTSLIKVLLAMGHCQIPPAAYFRTPHAEIDWDALPFYVPTSPVAWPAGRRAAVDAFGVGGLNAHVIVDDYVPGSYPKRLPAAYRREAAIAGRGCVFAGARNVGGLEQIVRSGRSAIVPVPSTRWDAGLYCQSMAKGGFITDFAYDWRKHKIPPREMERADPLQFLLLEAAGQALSEAGYQEGRIDGARTAVVVGTMFGGDFLSQLSRCILLPEFAEVVRRRCREAAMCDCEIDSMLDSFRRRYLQDSPALSDETGSFSSSTLASRIARTFDLKGGAFAVDAGEASSLAAVSIAMDLLASGRCEAVVCAGAQSCMDIVGYEKLASGGALTQRTGDVPGEGAGVVVLKRSSGTNKMHWTIRDCKQTREVGAGDGLASQIGDTMGASGMASLLGATVRPGAAREIAIHSKSSLGVNYELALQTHPAESAKPRIAMMFAGQGSQYEGMLRDVIQQRPVARSAMQEFDCLLAAYSLPSFGQMAWDEGNALGSDILRTELAMVGADYILYQCVLETGLTPDVVAGHSLGEHIALVAAGCITLEQAIRMALLRDRLLREHPEVAGGLLAVGASRDQVDEIAAACSQPVYVSVHNAARQIVLGGGREALEEFAARAERNKIGSKLLEVPRPFHTPLMRPVQAEFLRAMEKETVRPPRIPLLGTMNCRYLAEPAEIREYLSTRMVTTVRYYDAVARLTQEETPLALIEVGPRQVLTGLHRAFVTPGIETISTDHAVRGAQQMAQVEALAARLGIAQKPKVEKAAAAEGPEVIHFDATERRRTKNRGRARIETPEPEPANNKLADFLVQFVCERTGYPPDVVSLDADLEAELGIDSIKKVQLLAELRSRSVLTIPPDQKITLRDFPSLRSILNYIERLNDAKSVPVETTSENRRYVLRTVEAPAASAASGRHLEGPVTIAGNNPLRDALAEILPQSDGGLVRHLILTQGRDEPEPPLESFIEIHSACQQWLREVIGAGALGQASITAVTALGGDFGFSGNIRNLLGAGLSGLLKGLRREFPELRVKVIDAPAEENGKALAERAIAEIESGGPELEVAYVGQVRRVPRGIAEAAQPDSRHPLPDGGSWVVTGGARGITALIASELGRRYKVRLHLIGLTSLRESDERGKKKRQEIHQTLAGLQAQGISATYYGCDVSDRGSLAEVLQEIRQSGPITGVLHGAAFESAVSFVQKDRDDVTRTIATKVLGARNLMELTRQDRLTHFVGFGSVAGRFGGFGQSDYSAASELLCKMVQRYRQERPDVAAVAFHWPAWSGTGLAMRPQTKVLLEMRGIRFLTPGEGTAHFFAELEAGCPETEVLIASDAGGLDPDKTLNGLAGPRETEVVLDPALHSFLRDHRWRGHALLPAAASAMLLLEAAQAAEPARKFCGLRDFVIHNPLRTRTEPVAVQIRSGVPCIMTRPLHNKEGKLLHSHHPLASAIAYDQANERPAALPHVDESTCEWKPVPYRDLEQAESVDMVYFGPSMRCLRELSASAGRVIAPSAGFDAPLLDACFVACGIYSMQKLNSPVLVHGVADLRLGRPPQAGERCLLQYLWRGEEELFHVFDFSLSGENGDPILYARRCTMVKRGGAG